MSRLAATSAFRVSGKIRETPKTPNILTATTLFGFLGFLTIVGLLVALFIPYRRRKKAKEIEAKPDPKEKDRRSVAALRGQLQTIQQQLEDALEHVADSPNEYLENRRALLYRIWFEPEAAAEQLSTPLARRVQGAEFKSQVRLFDCVTALEGRGFSAKNVLRYTREEFGKQGWDWPALDTEAWQKHFDAFPASDYRK